MMCMYCSDWSRVVLNCIVRSISMPDEVHGPKHCLAMHFDRFASVDSVRHLLFFALKWDFFGYFCTYQLLTGVRG